MESNVANSLSKSKVFNATVKILTQVLELKKENNELNYQIKELKKQLANQKKLYPIMGGQKEKCEKPFLSMPYFSEN